MKCFSIPYTLGVLSVLFITTVSCQKDNITQDSAPLPQNRIDTISGMVQEACTSFEYSPDGPIYYGTQFRNYNRQIAIHVENGEKYVLRPNSQQQSYERVYFDSLGLAEHFDGYSGPSGVSNWRSHFRLQSTTQGFELELIHFSSNMGNHDSCYTTGLLIE